MAKFIDKQMKSLAKQIKEAVENYEYQEGDGNIDISIETEGDGTKRLFVYVQTTDSGVAIVKIDDKFYRGLCDSVFVEKSGKMYLHFGMN